MAPRRTSPPRAVARVAPLPHRWSARGVGWLRPSGRAVLVGAALVVAAVGLYYGARATSVFAVRTFDVHGASPATADRVRAALEQVSGESLLGLELADVVARLERIPEVASAGLDRAFPHTLVVFVREERPAAVVRRGADAWLVAASGRVLRPLEHGSRPPLPRVWVSKQTTVAPGQQLQDVHAAAAVAAVARIPAGFPGRVRDTRMADEGLTLALASGVELRLGDGSEIGLKLAVASCILPSLHPDESGSRAYLDVSVAERPVSGGTLNSEVEVEC